jgi:hypothetical protein
MFKDWYERKGFRTLQECADFLGLHKATVSRMLSRPDYRPDKFTAMHIARKTRGDVPADSWRERA